MKHVMLLAAMGALNAGETASFDDKIADELIAAKKARLEPVPSAVPTTPDALKRKLHDAEIGEVHKALDEIKKSAEEHAAEVQAHAQQKIDVAQELQRQLEADAKDRVAKAEARVQELEAQLAAAQKAQTPATPPVKLEGTDTASGDAPAQTTTAGK